MKQAMLLAAGRGSRLAPLTDATPKPLVCVGGEPLLQRHIRRFAAAGYQRLVINLHHLGGQIRQQVGDGSAFGVDIQYSPEEKLLGAAGGIRLALERGLLTAPFTLANGDVICDYDVGGFSPPPAGGCHLLLVPNPPAKPQGDFSLNGGSLAAAAGGASYTYAGMGVYDPALFAALPAGHAHAMLPLLQKAIAAGCASGELYSGRWHDIGTPAALAAAQRQFGEIG